MPQIINQLTTTQVQKIKDPGMYADGAGLYLQVTGEDAKSWILRYSLRGRARRWGLAPSARLGSPRPVGGSRSTISFSTITLIRSSTEPSSEPPMPLPVPPKRSPSQRQQRPTSHHTAAV